MLRRSKTRVVPRGTRALVPRGTVGV